jgi:hypothetical protein
MGVDPFSDVLQKFDGTRAVKVLQAFLTDYISLQLTRACDHAYGDNFFSSSGPVESPNRFVNG